MPSVVKSVIILLSGSEVNDTFGSKSRSEVNRDDKRAVRDVA